MVTELLEKPKQLTFDDVRPLDTWRSVCIGCGNEVYELMLSPCPQCGDSRWLSRNEKYHQPKKIDFDFRNIPIEKRDRLAADYWEPGGMVFVHYNKRYAVDPTGKTACLGTVEENDTSKADKNVTESTPATSESVPKIGKVSQHGCKRGRPTVTVKDTSILNDDKLSLRQKAKLLGIGRMTVSRKINETK